MNTSKFRELWEEFRLVSTGRSNLADSILPPIVFLIINGLLGFKYAMWSSLVLALFIAAMRLRRQQSLIYAFGGLGGIALAILTSKWLGRAEGYFLPGIVMGIFTAVISVASVIVGRPLVAWTSYIVRRWPLDWYWHPRVRPAYSEVTVFWSFFFAIRLVFQFSLFRDQATELLAVINVITGWPATVALLAISYLYGTWRLQHLKGPSVKEFRQDAPAPWTGQRQGF
jgi:hypothetical protein